MIDQIRLFSVDLGSGIRDFMEGNSHSWFFPNPVTSTATFTMNKTHRDVRFELMDSRGVVILTGRYGTCDEFIFDRKSIPPGIYFMRLSMDNQLTDFHKIVIAE